MSEAAEPATEPETSVRVHEDRLASPSPRIEMTPSEAVHLSTEGRRPRR